MGLTQKQIDERRLSIGGSDIAAIAGVSPHKSALKLYLGKIGEDEDEDRPESDNQIWGNLLEDSIAQFYAIKHKVDVQQFTEKLVHPDYDFLTANPDRVILSKERVIEIKTSGMGGIDFWRSPENTKILRPPQHVILQGNWYLGFIGWDDMDIILLHFCEGFGLPERYVEFQISFDRELFDLEMELAINFWNNHVLPKNPPESEDADEMAEYLKHEYKFQSEGVLSAGPEEDEIARRLFNATKQFNHWKQQKAIEGNSLKGIIGENSSIRGSDWVYNWKFTSSGGTDWKKLAIDKGATQKEIDDYKKPGYRRPYFKYKGEVDDS